MRNLLAGALLALSADASRTMRMVIAADDVWQVNATSADGTVQQLGSQTSWHILTTLNQVLYGPGNLQPS